MNHLAIIRHLFNNRIPGQLVIQMAGMDMVKNLQGVAKPKFIFLMLFTSSGT